MNTIDKEFIPDKVFLHQDFYASHNKEKRTWFFEHFLESRKIIQSLFYDFVQKNKVNIMFFDWFEIYASENNILYPFKVLNPVTIRKKVTVWETANGQSIESEHPPLRLLKLPIGDETIDACPYKKPQDSDAQNLKNIVVQNNFTNAHLHSIGKQLSRIEGQPHPSVEPSGTMDKRLKNPHV